MQWAEWKQKAQQMEKPDLNEWKQKAQQMEKPDINEWKRYSKHHARRQAKRFAHHAKRFAHHGHRHTQKAKEWAKRQWKKNADKPRKIWLDTRQRKNGETEQQDIVTSADYTTDRR